MLVALTWRSPWGRRLGELFEGRIVTSDIVAPFDLEIPDEARTSERIEQARRAVDDVYLFDAKAGERVEQELGEALAPGSAQGPADPALAAALRGPRGPETIAALREDRRAGSSPRRSSPARTPSRATARITVRYFGAGAEASLRDVGRIMDIEEARRRAREEVARLGTLDPALAAKAGDWLAGADPADPDLRPDGDAAAHGRGGPAGPDALLPDPPRHGGGGQGDAAHPRRDPHDRRDPPGAAPRLRPGRDPGAAADHQLPRLLPRRYARDAQPFYSRIRHLFPFLAFILVLHAALCRAGISLAELLARNLESPIDRPETLWYLIPAAAGAVLVTLLANHRIATVYSLFACAVIAILFEWSLPYALFALIAHLAGVYSVTHYRTRTALLRSGLAVGLAGAAAVAGLDAVANGFQAWQTGLADALFAFLGGAVGVPLLVAFLLPILELVFGVLTDIRLLELSNLDNPLLSQLALRAPGSYNHSVIVGTLAEAAADAIGANPLFCRVAAYYHDIGKMRMPEYYIENQRPGENPHDRLAPSMSALIISNHVKEGIRLGREHNLPEPILDIIPQHHGTRVMTYFYEKAKTAAAAAGAPPPNADDFRHPGPKPSSKEGAIFMLADSVEAAARTLAEPNDEKFRQLIRQISSRAILDGQFDHCDLTFSDLDRITDAFVRTLGSIYHHRIDYPTFIFEGAQARRGPREGRLRREHGAMRLTVVSRPGVAVPAAIARAVAAPPRGVPRRARRDPDRAVLRRRRDRRAEPSVEGQAAADRRAFVPRRRRDRRGAGPPGGHRHLGGHGAPPGPQRAAAIRP